MRKIIFPILVCASCIIFTSCKKENSANNTIVIPPPPLTNNSPIAVAGPDQVIYLPLDNAIVDGSGSTDPDGTIVSYLWTKISGPTSLIVVNPNLAKTSINQLVQGTYLFELLIKDNGGLSAKDTMQITVNAAPIFILPGCNMSLTPIGNLSIARKDILTASAGNKILFAGGISSISPFVISSRVDIYDMASQTWSMAELSLGRVDMAVAVVGTKIFFAGGFNNLGKPSSRVDIYDASVNTWSTAELSIARGDIGAASADNKVLFAGGWDGDYNNDYGIFDIVDIYNAITNIWSTSHLSEPNAYPSATVLNHKIYFAGRFTSSKVDIYDALSNLWSVISKSEPSGFMATIGTGNTIFWAGGEVITNGVYISNKVEMYDVITGNSTNHQLSAARSHFQAVMKNNKILFYTGNNYPLLNNIDVYDINTQTWSACSISQAISGQSIIAAAGKVYVAGGYLNGAFFKQVWLLDF